MAKEVEAPTAPSRMERAVAVSIAVAIHAEINEDARLSELSAAAKAHALKTLKGIL